MNKMISVTVPMPTDRHNELREASRKAGMSQAAYMRQAAYKEMDNQKDKENTL